jgi:hypothetical protein
VLEKKAFVSTGTLCLHIHGPGILLLCVQESPCRRARSQSSMGISGLMNEFTGWSRLKKDSSGDETKLLGPIEPYKLLTTYQPSDHTFR